jgi:hypothetical protein
MALSMLLKGTIMLLNVTFNVAKSTVWDWEKNFKEEVLIEPLPVLE